MIFLILYFIFHCSNAFLKNIVKPLVLNTFFGLFFLTGGRVATFVMLILIIVITRAYNIVNNALFKLDFFFFFTSNLIA